MRVLYFDCCKQDCAEFSRFFYDLQRQRPVLRDTELICGSLEVMEPIRNGAAIDVGFIDFFIADTFCSESVQGIEEIHELYPNAQLYGLIPFSEYSCDIQALKNQGILQRELLYKNTEFLHSCIEDLICERAEYFAQQDITQKIRTLAKRLFLVQ